MKVETLGVTGTFSPVTIAVTIESEEELRELCKRLHAESYTTDYNACRDFEEAVDTLMDNRGIEP